MRKRLALLKRYHATAVELGAQSMDEEVLRLNRRGHTAQDTRRAAALIKGAGLELGLQMMTGLYGSTPEKDLDTARQLIALGPDTARIYPTIVLEHHGAGPVLPGGFVPAARLWKRRWSCAGKRCLCLKQPG